MHGLTRAPRALARGGKVLWVMEDVKGGFNNVLVQEVLDVVGGSRKKGWCRWLRDFFRPRQFEVEWDGTVWGRGSANVGVPQGSPLSPEVFLIWMAPILEKMERKLKEGAGGGAGVAGANAEVDFEVPSFVDDMCIDIISREGINNNNTDMQLMETNVKRIVREVAEASRMPIETDKEEVLHLQESRKKRNADRKYVKWLGVIFDNSLDFDIHWKSWLAKASKALGALSGVGGSQWGMCPGGWKMAYEGMIRSIAS